MITSNTVDKFTPELSSSFKLLVWVLFLFFSWEKSLTKAFFVSEELEGKKRKQMIWTACYFIQFQYMCWICCYCHLCLWEQRLKFLLALLDSRVPDLLNCLYFFSILLPAKCFLPFRLLSNSGGKKKQKTLNGSVCWGALVPLIRSLASFHNTVALFG